MHNPACLPWITMSWSKTPPVLVAVLWLAFPAVSGCRAAPPGERSSSMQISASSFQNGHIPASFTCDGQGTSPDLSWSAPPQSARSLALLVTDPDAPSGTFTHWVLYNLPASAHSLNPGLPAQGQLPDGSRQGRNDFGRTGYGGPCPPGHSEHRYFFTLYALDAALDLPPGATRGQVEEAMKGHVIDRGELVARYGR